MTILLKNPLWTMAAHKDTLRHILSNWPTDLQIPSTIQTAFSILDFQCRETEDKKWRFSADFKQRKVAHFNHAFKS